MAGSIRYFVHVACDKSKSKFFLILPVEDKSDDSGLGTKPMGTFGVRRVLFLLALLIAAGALVARYWPVERDRLIPVFGTNGKVGAINADGRMTIEPEWDWMTFSENSRLVFVASVGESGASFGANPDLTWTLIDRVGKVVSGPWDVLGEFDSLEMVPVEKDGKWGWVNVDGNLVIPNQWEVPSYRTAHFMGIISYGEDELLEVSLKFDDQGMGAVAKDGLVGWIDRNGDVVLPPKWECGLHFGSDDLAIVGTGGKYGWINRKGEVVVALEWDQIGFLSEDSYEAFDANGWAMVKKGEACGWIDREGNVVVPLEWEWIGPFDSEGMAPVRKDGRWGWIDRSGNLLIENEWDSVYGFDEGGMARVMGEDGKWGWINRGGDVVIERAFGWAGSFDEQGMAKVAVKESDEEFLTDGSWITRSGELLVLPGWEQVSERIAASAFRSLSYGGRHFRLPDLQTGTGFDQFGLAVLYDQSRTAVINREGEVIFSMDEFISMLDEVGQSPVSKDVIAPYRYVIDKDGEVVYRFPEGYEWQQVPLVNEIPGARCMFSQREKTRLEEAWEKVAGWFGVGQGGDEKGEDRLLLSICFDVEGNMVWSSAWIRFETKCWWVFGAAMVLALALAVGKKVRK